jgi:uncharacterized protein involved in type VI secretion and phage assembly
MHPFANATHLRLDISRPALSFDVLTCKGNETVNQPYAFELEIVNPTGLLDAHELLFSAAWLHSNGSTSGIHGHIQSIVRSSTEPAPSNLLQVVPVRYLITLGPRLGLMAYRHNQRIFQGMNAEQIIIQVLSEHGIDDAAYLWQRKRPCVERDYCAQYCESDLQLLQRLCEEEGMHYYFLHTRSRHVVVFTDKPQDLLPLAPLDNDTKLANKPVPKGGAAVPQRMSMHRACVVGGMFEPARLDAKGRLKVRFDWSNQGDGARFNDCWIPIDPALMENGNQWWGGMEVVVNFRDGDPNFPYISDRLWDPDINPRVQPDPVITPRRILTTRIDKEQFLDASQQFSIDDQLIVRMAQDNEMHFRVGSSLVTIDSKSISLSGLRIILSSIAEAEEESAAKHS